VLGNSDQARSSNNCTDCCYENESDSELPTTNNSIVLFLTYFQISQQQRHFRKQQHLKTNGNTKVNILGLTAAVSKSTIRLTS